MGVGEEEGLKGSPKSGFLNGGSGGHPFGHGVGEGEEHIESNMTGGGEEEGEKGGKRNKRLLGGKEAPLLGGSPAQRWGALRLQEAPCGQLKGEGGGGGGEPHTGKAERKRKWRRD